MRFGLTREQEALEDSVRDLVTSRFPLSWIHRVYDDPAVGADPPDLWQAAAEHGWLAVLMPEEHGGLGLGLLEAALVVRRFGAALLPGPYLATLVSTEAVRRGGSGGQRDVWLPRLARGELKATFAFRSPRAHWDDGGIGFVADRHGLHGRAGHVEFAAVADVIVAAAKEPSGVGLYLVDPRHAAVSVQPVTSLDRTTQFGTVVFDGVPAERLEAGSRETFLRVVDSATLLYAHELVGLACEALRRTVCYAIERVQFGRPIGAFQAIKHMLAGHHVATVMADHTTLYAAYAYDEALPSARLAICAAKAKASDTARAVVADMIQLHGGIAFTWEHDAHMYLKRAKRDEYLYGDAAWHREQIAKLIVDQADSHPPADWS
jgi:alkylation response protein AidB-like acyl-CoA dehydrogenase